jgi:hypothetical protein
MTATGRDDDGHGRCPGHDSEDSDDHADSCW